MRLAHSKCRPPACVPLRLGYSKAKIRSDEMARHGGVWACDMRISARLGEGKRVGR
jgi:hypothetical protein